jgi:hypothetical protein
MVWGLWYKVVPLLMGVTDGVSSKPAAVGGHPMDKHPAEAVEAAGATASGAFHWLAGTSLALHSQSRAAAATAAAGAEARTTAKKV